MDEERKREVMALIEKEIEVLEAQKSQIEKEIEAKYGGVGGDEHEL